MYRPLSCVCVVFVCWLATHLSTNCLAAVPLQATDAVIEKTNKVRPALAGGSRSEDLKKILVPINHYIKGTSYGLADKLRSAFVPDAKMFLDHKDKPLFLMTIEEYAGRVEKHTKKPGKFNGRVTNVLSIQSFQGIATAKLEVFIPRLKKRFVDLLLLKNFPGGWKIISKTAASESFEMPVGNVLLVLSNIKTVEKGISVGNCFDDLVKTLDAYRKKGYHVEMMSEKGGRVSLENIDASNKQHLDSLFNPDFMFALENTKSAKEIDPSKFQIIHFTSSNASIFDLPNSRQVQKVAMAVYQNDGIVAANGLGTAAVSNLRLADGSFLVKGKNVTGPSADSQNRLNASRVMPFEVEEVLKSRGAKIVEGKTGEGAVQVADRLVTGSGIQASTMVVEKAVSESRLKDQRKK